MINHQIAVTENGTKTLLTAGKYCDRNIDLVVNVSSIENHNVKVYTGTITETVVGASKYASLVKNDFLKEHRNDESLFVRVEFDVEPAPYAIVKTWGYNSLNMAPNVDNEAYQFCRRYGPDGITMSTSRPVVKLANDSPIAVGCLQITEDGELRIYSNSTTNYAIRPSNYTVIVEW